MGRKKKDAEAAFFADFEDDAVADNTAAGKVDDESVAVGTLDSILIAYTDVMWILLDNKHTISHFFASKCVPCD